LLSGAEVQLVVFCTTIEAQIILELDCFFGAENKVLNALEGNNFVDETTGDVFTLF